MKLFHSFGGALAAALTCVNIVTAANSFAGSNLYYAAGLDAATRTKLLECV